MAGDESAPAILSPTRLRVEFAALGAALAAMPGPKTPRRLEALGETSR
ncbi:hypothetical protein AB0I28_34515 [Phytomonospora sp. NPDC050363]